MPLATLIASTRNVLADDAAWASYDVDAATTHMEWNDMNAASTPYDPVLARSDVGRAVAGSG